MRKQRSGYATMPVAKLARICDLMTPFSKRGIRTQTRYPAGELPSKAYDGLMSSSNIAVFDYNLQQQLHKFYGAVPRLNYSTTTSGMDDDNQS